MQRRIITLWIAAVALLALASFVAAQETTPEAPAPAATEAPNALGVVLVDRLNVRAAPDTSSAIVTQIELNSQHPVTGRTADGEWWQITLPDGSTGWVASLFMSIAFEDEVPLVDPSGTAVSTEAAPSGEATDVPAPAGAALATVLANRLNYRSAPAIGPNVLGQVLGGEVYAVVGRTTDGEWWQIQLNDGSAVWVNSTFMVLPDTFTGDLPITGGGGSVVESTAEPGAESTAEAVPAGSVLGTVLVNRLNVRSAPTTTSDIVATSTGGQRVAIVGRTADSSWWQVNVDGTTGWVYSVYVEADEAVIDVPVNSESTDAQTTAGAASPNSYFATVTIDVILRSGPGSEFQNLAGLLAGRTVRVIGRNADSTWFQVDVNGTIGWITSAGLPINVDISQVAVVSASGESQSAEATAEAPAA